MTLTQTLYITAYLLGGHPQARVHTFEHATLHMQIRPCVFACLRASVYLYILLCARALIGAAFLLHTDLSASSSQRKSRRTAIKVAPLAHACAQSFKWD